MRNELDLLMLGPLEARDDTGLIHLGGPNARMALATLLISANHSVSMDTIVWAVWGDKAPPSAESTVQSHISRLRHILGHGAIVLEDHSYLLVVECERVDACRFERLVRKAEDLVKTDPEEAAHDARAALALWRGPVLGDLGDKEFAHFEAVRLEEVRLIAVEIEVEAELGAGWAMDAVPRLQALTAEYPFREHFWRQLVAALTDVDRRIEAAQAYDRYCRIMRDQGFEPSFQFGELAR